MATSSKPPVVIVGAGVIGLTIAVVLRERGYQVFLLGRDLPTDSTSQQFASVWAGANWCSYAGPGPEDVREQQWETATWNEFLKIRELRPDLVALIPFLQFLPNEVKSEDIWFSHLCPNFRTLGHIEDGFGAQTFALAYDSITLQVPHMLQYLVERATKSSASGPPVEIHRIPSLTSLASALTVLPASYPAQASAPIIVNATGLGAHDLSDVLDTHVHPARGQTVLIYAPRVHRCVMHAGSSGGLSLQTRSSGKKAAADSDVHATHEGGAGAADFSNAESDPDANQPTYVIPRAQSGDVILGGTYQAHRRVFAAEENATLRIVTNCHRICPEIAYPYREHRYRLRKQQQHAQEGTHPASSELCPATGEPSFVWTPSQPNRLFTASEALQSIGEDDDVVEILRVNVGMRPAREGKARSDRTKLAIPQDIQTPALVGQQDNDVREVDVVHAYGHGPAGYQQSWGVAHATADLVDQASAAA